MPKHILFVEDNANTAMALKVMLELKGYKVTTADSVHAAKNLLARDSFDVLISDITLPDGHGWDLLASEKLPPRSIATSGHIAEADRDHALGKGFDAYVTKPFATEVLIAEIEAA